MLEVIAGIGDHHQIAAGHDPAEAERELAAADAAAQCDHDPARSPEQILVRRRGSASRPARAAASTTGLCTRIAGRASSDCPISSDAALAISSAKPVCVTRSACPNRSGRPRMSTSAGSPAAPSATPTVPRRHGRPQLSVMITASACENAREPRAADKRRRRPDRAAAAAPAPPPRLGSTLERSTPAFAMMNPSRCSTISTPGRLRTTRRDSARMTSTSRGSLSTSAARLERARRRLHLRRDRRGGLPPWRRSSAPAQHVTIRGRSAARSQAAISEGGEVVARPDHRDVGNRGQREGHCTKSRVPPARRNAAAHPARACT